MVKYKCTVCEKQFVGDYGLGMFPACSPECEKKFQERFERNMRAYVKLCEAREERKRGARD